MGKTVKTQSTSERRSAISRPRLLAALDDALCYPVTIVRAPAGFGKTVLARQWASRAHATVAVVDAAGKLGPAQGVAQGLSHLAGEDAVSDVPLNCLALAERIAQRSGHAVVIIDNVATQVLLAPEGADEVYRMLAALPANVHAVFLSRGRVPVNASRLRMEGKLLELSTDGLGFTELETREVLHPLALDSAAVHRIFGASYGWPAGVRMAAIALEKHPDAASKVFEAAWLRLVGEYTLDVILPDLPDDARVLVESLSYIGEFTEELARTVMSWDVSRTAAAIVGALDAGAPLVESTAADGTRVLAVHPLVAAGLAAHTASLGVGKAVAVQRACTWCEQHGFAGRAVTLAAHVGDWDRIAAVIARRWRAMFAQSRSADLLKWFSLLPREYVLSHPKLAAVEVLPLAVFGQQLEVYENLRAAMPEDRGRGDELAYLYWSVRCVALASIGDVEQAVFAGNCALSILPDNEEYLRAMVSQSLGGASAIANPARACQMFLDAVPLALRQGMRNPLCSAYANASRLCAHIGKGDDALDCARRAEAIAADVPSMQAMYAQAVLAKAQVRYDRDDLEGCRAALQWLSDAARLTRIPEHTAHALVLSALVSHRKGDEEAACDDASAAALLSPAGVVRSFAPLSALRSWAESGAFSAKTALSELESSAQESPYAQVVVLSARFARDEVRPDDAPAVLALADAVEQAPRYRVRALVLAALLLERAGDAQAAEDALQQAFSVAEPYNLARTFLDEPDIAPVWQRVCRANASDTWAARLYLSNVGAVGHRRKSAPAALTERELDVMRLAAQGLTLQGIADELFVSRETVKKHLANVYQKLDVHTKLQAVSLLRERGVL